MSRNTFLFFSFFIAQFTFCAEHDPYRYSLSVQKLHDTHDAFKVKVGRSYKTDDRPLLPSQSKQKGSFIADFSNHTIKDAHNMFTPFDMGATNFIDHNSDWLLWNIPDFGLLKIARDNSVYFGHGSEEVPLTHHDIALKTPGTLFLQCLKAKTLCLKSPETRLSGTVLVDKLFSDNYVRNSGGLNAHCLEGQGELLNEGVLELQGTSTNPAIVAIKKMSNKNHIPGLTATIKGNYVELSKENKVFDNGKNALLNITDKISANFSPNFMTFSFINKGIVKARTINLERPTCNEGFWQAHTLSAQKLFTNEKFGEVKILDEGTFTSTVSNKGDWQHYGKLIGFAAATIHNEGNFRHKNGTISFFESKAFLESRLKNYGTWWFENVTNSGPFGSPDMLNNGTLYLKNSAIAFTQLNSVGDLVLHSGKYAAELVHAKRLDVRGNDWTITDDAHNSANNRLSIANPQASSFKKIECQDNLLYDTTAAADSIHAQGDINCSKRYPRALPFLEKLHTPEKVTVWCDTINMLKPSQNPQDKDFDFSTIGHLDMFVNGRCTSHYALKAPALSLNVAGLLTSGKNNEELGTIAATHGPLTVIAHAIDGRFGKFYGKGKTLAESTQSDITIGAPTRGVDEDIKRQFSTTRIAECQGCAYSLSIVQQILARFNFSLNQRNGSYIASDNTITVKSAANIFLTYGTLISALKNHLVARNEIQNFSGKISSQESITIEADVYNHLREGAADKGYGTEYPGSGPAVLESLKRIDILVKKVCNRAGSMRSGEDIYINGSNLAHAKAEYIEEPQHFYRRYFNGHGWGTDWGWKAILLLTQSCVTQAAHTITMNLGDFTITGNMNAGTIGIQGKSGLFANTSLLRETVDITKPRIVNVTHYMHQQAQQPGMYILGADNSIQTEFPFGNPSHAGHNDQVLLANQEPAPLNWKNIFNPLSAINLNLHLQQLLSSFAGKVYAKKAKGNNLSSVLWSNAGSWRKKHNKEIMSAEDIETIDQSMLLTQILNAGANEEQHTLLCIAPQDLNPYQSSGDIVADTIAIITEDNQTHFNNRLVAHGPQGIDIKSTAGAVNLETQSYTVSHETREYKVVEQRAMPQQQIIAQAGPVAVNAHKTLSRTGTVIAAAQSVTEQSHTGSVKKNPLILQKMVETRHEKNGWFSSSQTIETSLTHSAMVTETIAGTQLHDKAATSINAVAPQDSAGQEIVYEAPHTHIEGLILADRTTSSSSKSGWFTDEETKSSKETPFALPTHIRSPLVRFVGQDAHVNATIQAKELRDETEKGIQFIAKVAQMLCSEQKLISSPLFSADVGYKAGYETMIAPMLMVEKIVRLRDEGHMIFESAIINKDRTEIIGKFVETTYHLKQWQRNWNHTSQVIPDAALVVVAVAITFATQGAGVEFMAPLLESITAATGMQLSAAGIAAVNAGLTTIWSSMGTSFLRTGDPLGTIEHIASPCQIKSIAINMASAGLCSKLGNMLDITMAPGIKPLSAHFQEQALRSTVDSLLNVAINNTPVNKALSNALQQIPLKAIAAYASNAICAAYMNEMSKQAVHTVVGGLSGFAQDHSTKGFVSGATGALTAEIVGEILIADASEIADAAITTLTTGKKALTPENIQQAVAKEVQKRTDLAKIAAVGVAALINQNPTIAMNTAANVIDNDIAIRGTFYALAEIQSLLQATSQAYATLHVHQEKKSTKILNKKPRPSKNSVPRNNNEAAHDLLLQLIQKNPNKYFDIIMQCAAEQRDQPAAGKQRSLHDRIVNPKIAPIFVETGRMFRIAFIDAFNKTIDLYALIPNPVGIACYAGGTGRDLYQNKTTVGQIIYNTALTLGALKGIQLTGKGIKVVYQKGAGMIKDITDKVITRVHQYRYARQGRVPFVENPRAGTWTEATIGEETHLTVSIETHIASDKWRKDSAGPFTVFSHGSPYSVVIDNGLIHSKGLSQANLFHLEEKEFVSLSAIQLARFIRTASEYKKGQHIHLFGCLTGAKSNGIAQQLANIMNVPVSAPTKSAFLNLFGELTVIGPGINNFGVIKTFYPKTNYPYHLIALSLIPGFALTGDQQHPQTAENTEIPADKWVAHFFDHDHDPR